MKVSYEWLQSFFEERALPSVEEVVDKLIFHAYEVEEVVETHGTHVIDIDVLPNRSSDSLSHRGIAREIATLFAIPMSRDPLRIFPQLEPVTEKVHISLEADASCEYYSAAYITGVTVGPSPDWLKKRIESIGQKSINNVVDATNYVLFELGQPTHVFDAQKFTGDTLGIGVRLARPEESITLLGGAEVTLPDSVSVITDSLTDDAVAIAGVKGGVLKEVDESTTDVIVESAKFDPTATRKASQKLKLRTDASARYENDVPGELAGIGVQAVAELIERIAGGEIQGYTTAGSVGSESVLVNVSEAHIERLLGVKITTEEIESILQRLEFGCVYDSGVFAVTPPFERHDIRIPEDVIEEIGRVYGYNKIESKQLDAPERLPQILKKYAWAERIRKVLDAQRATEVYLYSLRDSGEVQLQNALASDKDHLRSNLSDGIRESLERNEYVMPILGRYDEIALYEIGNVFSPTTETTHVAVGARVSGTKKRDERTQERLKELRDALESELATSLPVTKESDGVFEFSLDALIQTLPAITEYPDAPIIAHDIVYTPSSQYPFVLRDIAVWVPENVHVDAIVKIIESHAGALLQRCDVFDTFHKDNRVSYALHLVFQSHTETLTDGVVTDIMQSIEQEMALKEGWETR